MFTEADHVKRGKDVKTQKIGLEQLLPMQPQKSTQLTASSWTSRLQNHETINVCLSLSSLSSHKDEILTRKLSFIQVPLSGCAHSGCQNKAATEVPSSPLQRLQPNTKAPADSTVWGCAPVKQCLLTEFSHAEEVKGSWDFFFFFQIYLCV